MTWFEMAAPSLGSGVPFRAWSDPSGRWLINDSDGDHIHVTTDFQAYASTPVPTGYFGKMGTLGGACTDGVRWYIVGDQGLAWSDSLAPASWIASTTPTLYGTGTSDPGGRGIGYHGGVLVVVSRLGYYAVSTDSGATWSVKGQLPAPENVFDQFRVVHTGTHWVVVANSAQIAVSEDNGQTWVHQSPHGTLKIGQFAYNSAGWIAGRRIYDTFRSVNAGGTWAPSGIPTSELVNRFGQRADKVYRFRQFSPPAIFESDDLVTWTEFGHPVVDGNAPTDVFVGANALLATPGGVPSPRGYVWMFDAPPVVLSLPIAHQVVAGGEPIRLPIKHAVSPSYSVALPVSHSVISAAAVGGLAGSGGWPAAPSGAWRVVVVLGDADVSARLVGPVTVSRRDNDAAEAQFAFSPAAAIAPMDLIGQRVRVAFAELVGGMQVNAQALFTGVLETPTVELHTGVVSCQCHDQLQEVVAATGREWIDAAVGGRWAEAVSGAPEDNWDYLQERIASVPMSFALDRLQQLRIVPWRGSGLVVRSLHVQDPVDASLSVTLPSRSDLRTRTTVRCQYRYTRRRGRGATAAWAQSLRWFTGYNSSASPWLSKQWLTVSMIDSALSSVRGWELRGTIDIERPPAGVHPLGPAETDGGYVIRKDVAAELALGFAAAYTAEWTQTVTEDYTVTVILPDLEAAIGQVGEEVGATLQAAFDAEAVVDLAIPVSGDTSVAWQPDGFDVAARDNVLHTLCDRAWVAMYAASRAGRVRWKMPLRPDLWLDWWFELNTPWLNANGKVVEVRHVLDPDAGSALTEVAVAVGLPGNADAALPAWSLPAVAWPDESRPAAAYSFDVGTFVGGEVGALPDDESWNGFVTNVERGVELDQYNWYSRRLAIKAPDIDAADRDPLEVFAEATIDTAIPTSLLEIL